MLNDEVIYGTLSIRTIVCGPLDEHGREQYSKKVTLLSVRGLTYNSAMETIKGFIAANPKLAKHDHFHAVFVPDSMLLQID
jgi:hypothetical protein